MRTWVNKTRDFYFVIAIWSLWDPTLRTYWSDSGSYRVLFYPCTQITRFSIEGTGPTTPSWKLNVPLITLNQGMRVPIQKEKRKKGSTDRRKFWQPQSIELLHLSMNVIHPTIVWNVLNPITKLSWLLKIL